MAEEAQVCERLRGQDTCPFHSGHNISSLCKTCSILVCLECMTSSTHEGHTFKKIKDCLREPTNNLTRYLHKIDQILLKHVEKDVLATENEMKLSIHKQINDVQNLKDQSVEFKKEIEANTAGMIGLVNQHAHSVLEVLSQHITLLETLREYLLSEKKECQDTLAKGSEILRYDAGNETGEKINQINVPEHPKIQELQHIRMRWDNAQLLIRNAMGSLKDVKPKSTETTSTDTSSTPLPVSCAIHPSALSQFNNESPYFYAVTPITKATAWAGEYRHNISDNSYTTGNTLNLITNRGKLLRQITTDVPFRSLYIHPKTGMLYVGCYGDETLRGVDTTSGITDILFTCDIKPHRIKVTSDDQILVGTYGENNKVYRYQLDGKLINRSKDNHTVFDIDECEKTHKVVIASDEKGLVILTRTLLNLHTFTGHRQTQNKFRCFTAQFDIHGNVIVGDYNSKEIYILGGDRYDFIQKLQTGDMPSPCLLKLFNNIVWVECNLPRKVLSIDIS